MSAQPQWESTDDYTTDLLALVALGTAQGDADAEWSCFLAALRTAARDGAGRIEPNTLRPLIRGAIAPRRIGAFTNRALSQGLVEYSGEWQVSDDHAGRNGGKPARVMVWLGGAA
jgi:hypothetical protein